MGLLHSYVRLPCYLHVSSLQPQNQIWRDVSLRSWDSAVLFLSRKTPSVISYYYHWFYLSTPTFVFAPLFFLPAKSSFLQAHPPNA